MTTSRWKYPGARWWKFDFHTHTPASADTDWAQHSGSLSAEDWLLRYMQAEIDCVAVTDHNSGAWIDELKSTYEQMTRSPPAGFRELHLFPGVEISVNGGVHLLVDRRQRAPPHHLRRRGRATQRPRSDPPREPNRGQAMNINAGIIDR